MPSHLPLRVLMKPYGRPLFDGDELHSRIELHAYH